MAKKTDYKAAVKDFVNQVGKPEAQKVLVAAGVSLSSAQKLTNNNYPREIGQLLGAAIMRGIAASKQKAS